MGPARLMQVLPDTYVYLGRVRRRRDHESQSSLELQLVEEDASLCL
jgi:hypothetical protein